MLLLAACSATLLSPTDSVEIRLDRCVIRWSVEGGLAVSYDGREVIAPTPATVVAYPPGWAWSYSAHAHEAVSAELSAANGQQVLTIRGRSPAIERVQIITAGPGDRFTMEHTYVQNEWDGMMYQTCLVRPAVGWFVGATYRVRGPGGEAERTIGPAFDPALRNPFVDADHVEFDTLFGRLTIAASLPITLYDYAARDSFWLGRDGPFPRGVEQRWQAEFAFEPLPFSVGGLRIERFSAPERLLAEPLVVRFLAARENGGPDSLTARLVVGDADAPPVTEQEVRLSATPREITLSREIRAAGSYHYCVELVSEGQLLFRSPSLPLVVERALTLAPGRMPFVDEQEGSVIAAVAPGVGEGLELSLSAGGIEIARSSVSEGKRTQVPLSLSELPLGTTEIVAVLLRGDRPVAEETTRLVRAPVERGAVVVDNASHALVVDGLPFIPCSFYCVYPDVPVDEEATQGFNAVAPYLPMDISERRRVREGLRALMDRCAAVGMRFHLDVRGAAALPDTEEKWAWLSEEVEAFRGHPALLAYYLADEPELGTAPLEGCLEAYRRLKELDPYHPVTMVFCQAEAAARYARAMDICMTDPYPIPNAPVTVVTDFCRRIRSDLADTMPLWLVPQAFGGGEGWPREPSAHEERVMTYLGLIHGARGIQPFIRRAPIGNPTSPSLWSECRRLALEVGQLAPALASGEEAPRLTCSVASVDAVALAERGAVTVLAANTSNAPVAVEFVLDAEYSGAAEVLFENRSVSVSGGRWTDVVGPLGTRAYRMQLRPPPADIAAISPSNLVLNPSFEEQHNVGTPDGSYISMGSDRGASWYADQRVAVHGRTSLRLTTPSYDKGLTVFPFPIVLRAGQRYRVAVWARGSADGLRFRLAVNALDGNEAIRAVGVEWQEFSFEFAATEAAGLRVSPQLKLLDEGTAWFDALQVVALD